MVGDSTQLRMLKVLMEEVVSGKCSTQLGILKNTLEEEFVGRRTGRSPRLGREAFDLV